MVLLKLHLYDRNHPTQHELYINADHLLSLEPVDSHTLVKFINEEEVEVEETVEQLVAEIARKFAGGGG